MWLLNVSTLELKEFHGTNIPFYGILSHTWQDDEVTFRDMDEQRDTARHKAGYQKIQGCCYQASKYGLEWAWVDSCCIDKRSSAELSEAINSMFEWYRRAKICFVYLSDVSPNGLTYTPADEFSRSKWFTRGWTLQEMIAPRRMIYFDCNWTRIGSRGYRTDDKRLTERIAAITGVFESVLHHTKLPRDYSAAERMYWAAKRDTTREEDKAYCLMGLFNVHMPILYGEGLQKAFRRLQQEIIKASPDETIFAWRAGKSSSGLLADSPAAFAESRNVHQRALKLDPFRLYGMTNLGFSISVEFVTPTSDGGLVVPIGASCRLDDGAPRARLGLYLERVLVSKSNKQRFYRRIRCGEFCFAPRGDFGRGEGKEGSSERGDVAERDRNGEDIFVLEDDHFTEMRWVEKQGRMESWEADEVGLSVTVTSPRGSPRLS